MKLQTSIGPKLIYSIFVSSKRVISYTVQYGMVLLCDRIIFYSSYIYNYNIRSTMESDIQLLELARGIKDALIRSGFLTIKSVLNSTTADIASKVGVDLYIAQIIFQEAKRVEAEMTKVSAPLDVSIANSAATAAVAIEKEELNPI